jgi:hypothetical protein
VRAAPGCRGAAARLPKKPGSQTLTPPSSATAAFGAEATATTASAQQASFDPIARDTGMRILRAAGNRLPVLDLSQSTASFDKATNKLTLTGVSPVTVFFTDRPERIAGNMKTAAFIPLWSEGKDSFKSDPPNADVSLLEEKTLKQIVVELQDPVLTGDDLAYTIKILQGEMPAKAADVSVFIDIIGRPWTPLSYAGVARRAYRRAYWYR